MAGGHFCCLGTLERVHSLVQLGEEPWEGPVPFWGQFLRLRSNTCPLTPLVPGAISTLGEPSLPLEVLSQLLFLLILSCLLLHKGPPWLSFFEGLGERVGVMPSSSSGAYS